TAEIYSSLSRGERPSRPEFQPLRDLLVDPNYGPGAKAWMDDRAYWLGLLSDRPENISLSDRTESLTWAFRREKRQLPETARVALDSFAKDQGTTTAAILAAATAVYIGRLKGKSDVIVGWPV